MLTGRSKVAGVFGWPVSHSRSPRLHGFWLERYGIDGTYIPLPVEPGRLPEVARALTLAGFAGANVTIPHKEAAFACCDEVDDTAHRAGAVNTLVFQGGLIIGSNTDGWGFLASMEEQAPGWRATDGTVTLLGAGGAARSPRRRAPPGGGAPPPPGTAASASRRRPCRAAGRRAGRR